MTQIAMDGAELFTKCIAQATLVVKQVLPSHYANATPDAEYDVEDLVSHMMDAVSSIPFIIGGDEAEREPRVADGNIDLDAVDTSARWQAAVDIADTVIMDADPEDTIMYNGAEMTVDEYLLQISGDLLIHAWDLGEAIGMHVRFEPTVAETVIETTVLHAQGSGNPRQGMYASLKVADNADLQTRLLALFDRSLTLRTSY